MYQKKTSETDDGGPAQVGPTVQRVVDRLTKRIRRLVDEVGELEADALAWRAMQKWDIPKSPEEIEAEMDALFPTAEPAELAEIGGER